ncbi:MAG: DUF3368 domain-containing protein [Candidatus Parabeggiatoa sp. nov. 3]|nr:MAG: DUF3368 domain-containing protein [Gammaproteobacteria bacterium]RKZ68874.1 MAG: DUF3368 domain-containing protein [Gammaproteobacteria bacterium]RKZ89277.1 MAG: DUF3368 domain-containing protein [Gammaproteobacteria bacterium]HEW97711.1 DUF3368 domain-containing protein [Beggiatoa sp.]
MRVVSNTSPIINLANVGQLDLLNQLYGDIIIPQAVFHEITVMGAGQAGAQEVKTWSWFFTHTVQNTTLVNSLRLDLDAGEAEAIALALELKADLLLMDERHGCAMAQQMNLMCSGILGVLVKAKHQGLIAFVKPILDDLISTAGFWVNNALYHHILQTVSEDKSA